MKGDERLRGRWRERKCLYMRQEREGEAAMAPGASPCDSGMFPSCRNKRESGIDRERDV